MPKIRTLSQRFQKGHIRNGEPTYFVEKVLNSLLIDCYSEEYLEMLVKLNPGKDKEMILSFYLSIGWEKEYEEKHHTIRAGHHFKTDEEIQLAVWSGKPYASPQIKICPPLKVKCYDFEVFHNTMPQGIEWPLLVDGYDTDIEQVSKNDGLTVEDFKSWFKYPSPFVGQIIAWNDPKY